MFEVNVFDNGDHACVAWRPSGDDPKSWSPTAGCRGFAVQRRLKRAGRTTTSWLANRVGFEAGQKAPVAAEAWRWPLQRYLWWDYDVRIGDEVSYRVLPVTGTAVALQPPDEAGASGWTAARTLGSDFGNGISAWFNRGVIATQWVTRALKTQSKGGKARATLMAAIGDPDNQLRKDLSGLLRPAVLELLANAPGDVYAALYELNDPEVITALTGLGARLNLILANGAFKDGTPDENAAVRADLRNTPVKLHDRMVGTGHFAHNKFIVLCNAAGEPEAVFTGSTNLTKTGLCTQVNNGILIRNAAVAKDYFEAWTRLRDAGDGYPKALVAGNSVAQARTVGSTSVTPWFAATSKAQDLEAARGMIAGAKQGILFLFFNPGVLSHEPLKETLLQNIIEREAKGDLYVRGVVNQEIAGLTDADSSLTAPVSLVRSGREPDHLPRSVLVPDAIGKQYGNWETELKGASNVMVHSKLVVIDPFGDKPVVMTGSHNLGYKASHANDDNLAIVVGNAALAQAYAANVIAVFQEYRWRDYVGTHQAGVWKGLEDSDAWQAGHLKRERDEMLFWVPARQS